MDLVRELGAFAFASRLKRLGDRLKAEATLLYQKKGIEFSDSWFLVAYILSKNEILTVTDMAEALGISRPAISQVTGDMTRKGFVKSRADKGDRRRKKMSLTAKGKRIVNELEPIWEAIGECTQELLDSKSKNILHAISDIEDGLEKQNMVDRVEEKLAAKR